MRVLLVWPNSRSDLVPCGDIGAISEPLCLEYLAAGGKADGHEARILDLRLHPAGLEAALAEFDPDIVGVTAYSMHVRKALEICRNVKANDPLRRTVIGGHHASFLPEDFFEPEIDFLVVDGVTPLRRIADALEKGLSCGDIGGVRVLVGGVHVGGSPQESFDIDRLLFPDRSLTAADHRGF
jgi:hypothetical protein